MGILGLFRNKTKNAVISFGDNQGDSPENAIVINAPSSIIGIMAEYKYIEIQYGVRDVDWTVFMQSLITGNGKSYDLITIETILDTTVRGGIKFDYNITTHNGSQVNAKGYTRHAFLDRNGSVVRPPAFIRELIQAHFE